MDDFTHPRAQQHRYPSRGTLLLQHGNNIARCPVAKQLPQRLLMPGNLVLLYQFQKISRSVTGKRGLGEMWIRGEEVSRGRMTG